MNGILEDLNLLANAHAFADDGLNGAIDALSHLQPSLSDRDIDDFTYVNYNTGSGTQNNQNGPNGKQFNNTGGGPQYNPDTLNQYYGKDA
jgi:hypothetical protein